VGRSVGAPNLTLLYLLCGQAFTPAER